MCTYFVCLMGLLTALILAEPVSGDETDKTGAPAQLLCPFVRSAADQTQLEAEAGARLLEAERASREETDVWPAKIAPAHFPGMKEGGPVDEGNQVGK